jgi:predicted transcriptional regulator
MKNRRSKLEIYLDVLKVIKEGTTKPTRIMYGANLSWKLLQGILSSMVAQDLIEEIDVSDSRDKRTNTVYQVTTKGDSVIRYFDRAKGLIEVDEPDFNPLQIARGR